MCSRKRDAQAGGAFRHGWRANRGDQYPLCQKLFADSNRGLRIADDDRLDCSLAVCQFNTQLCDLMMLRLVRVASATAGGDAVV